MRTAGSCPCLHLSPDPAHRGCIGAFTLMFLLFPMFTFIFLFCSSLPALLLLPHFLFLSHLLGCLEPRLLLFAFLLQRCLVLRKHLPGTIFSLFIISYSNICKLHTSFEFKLGCYARARPCMPCSQGLRSQRSLRSSSEGRQFGLELTAYGLHAPPHVLTPGL